MTLTHWPHPGMRDSRHAQRVDWDPGSARGGWSLPRSQSSAAERPWHRASPARIRRRPSTSGDTPARGFPARRATGSPGLLSAAATGRSERGDARPSRHPR